MNSKNRIFIIEKCINSKDSYEQVLTIVEGAGGNDRVIKNSIKTKN